MGALHCLVGLVEVLECCLVPLDQCVIPHPRAILIDSIHLHGAVVERHHSLSDCLLGITLTFLAIFFTWRAANASEAWAPDSRRTQSSLQASSDIARCRRLKPMKLRVLRFSPFSDKAKPMKLRGRSFIGCTQSLKGENSKIWMSRRSLVEPQLQRCLSQRNAEVPTAHHTAQNSFCRATLHYRHFAREMVHDVQTKSQKINASHCQWKLKGCER